MKRAVKRISLVLALVLLNGMILPQRYRMPVHGADLRSYDARSFWYHPWGKSVTHKGVDIFAKAGTPVNSATDGLVVFTGAWGRGGQVVLVLGPKWRLHYCAHLSAILTGTGERLAAGEPLGTVGNTGKAAGKPAHLHYTIMTLVPLPWQMRSGPHGWRRMWYVDPTPLLNAAAQG